MYLGVEFGGTKLQLGLGRGDGRLVGLWRGAAANDGAALRSQLLSALPELLSQQGCKLTDIEAIGVGFGGPVGERGQTLTSHQVPGWDNFPLTDWLLQTFGKPVLVGNDADVAGLAEATYGAGRGVSPVFYVTVGSGIGGGLILDGAIYRGAGRGAAEIGHLKYYQDGQWVTVESVASGWGIEQRAARAGFTGLRVPQIAELAREGHEIAYRILSEAHAAVAHALCQMIALLCPKRVVIGGGVSLLGNELFFEPIRRLVAQQIFRPFMGLTDIVPAQLGEEVVLHGALALARQAVRV